MLERDDAIEIGQYLVTLRTRAGLSRTAVALRMNQRREPGEPRVSRQLVAQWERGRRRARVESAIDYAAACGVRLLVGKTRGGDLLFRVAGTVENDNGGDGRCERT